VSTDGKLTLTIPVGALSKTTTVSVEPVTNTASLGFGTSYHFMPEGTRLVKPATITYQYEEQELNGVDASHLAIAQQQPNHSWAITHSAAINTSKRTITSRLRDFSWASLVTKYLLTSNKAELIPGEEAHLYLRYAKKGFPEQNDSEGDDLLVPIPNFGTMQGVRQWTVNGQLFGDNESIGSLIPDPKQAPKAIFLYTAPEQLPAKGKRQIALGVELEHEGQANFTLICNVSIVPPAVLTIDGKKYEEVDVSVRYSVNEIDQSRYFSVQLHEKTKTAKISDFTVTLLKSFAGNQTYTLTGSWQELQISTFSVGGPATDGSGDYSTLYWGETKGEIGNPVLDPATLIIDGFDGPNSVVSGKISCTVYKEGKKPSAVKVSATFRGVVKNS
jgi:hypothetical protein